MTTNSFAAEACSGLGQCEGDRDPIDSVNEIDHIGYGCSNRFLISYLNHDMVRWGVQRWIF